MINNLQLIIPLLSFPTGDVFYHLQIIKRKKEHPELGSNSMIVKTYYIKSIEHLERIMPEVISICTFHDARGCINLNKRSFEKMAFQTLKKVTDQIMNKDYKSVRKAYESVCGSFAHDNEKKWIIDIDTKDPGFIAGIDETIRNLEPNVGEQKSIVYLPTKNGIHIISSPFNLQQFNLEVANVDVHKDNPTILYIP